jgi:hypothetical protein
MQILINKTKATAVMTIILLMASVTLMTMPVQPVQAQEITHGGSPGRNISGMPNLSSTPPAGVTPDYTFQLTAYMSLSPNPIGVGQPVLVNIWVSPGLYHAFYQPGYTVTIQKPDGTTVTVGPMDSYLGDATAWFEYTVDQAGTWKFKFDAPGVYIPAGNYTDRPGYATGTGTRNIPPNTFPQWKSFWYKGSSTDWQELTVQQEIVSSWPPAPLPTDYWTRPVSPMNREWWPILGSYPWTGAIYYPNGRVLYASNYQYTAYVQAPNTAHVVWKRQGAISGLIGGGTAGQYSLSAGGGTPSIIYAGRCYQTLTKAVDGKPTSVWECYDLRTGEVYWDLTGIRAPPTNVLYEKSSAEQVPGQEAEAGYSVYLVAISGGRLYKYNPSTGAATLNISIPLTSGTVYNNDLVLTLQVKVPRNNMADECTGHQRRPPN